MTVDYAKAWRTRVEIERDVLVALLSIPPFRARVEGQVRTVDWSTVDHRRVANELLLCAPDPTEVIEWVADVLACRRDSAMEWVLAGNPVSYDDDFERLVPAL